MDTSKKISFGFSKLTKKPNLISNRQQEEKKDVELVDCLEGQAIKIIGAVEVIDKPLVIPIKDNSKNLLDRIRESRKNKTVKPSVEDTRPDSELTLDELAARQLIQEAQKSDLKKKENKVDVFPLKVDDLPLDGGKEPTIEDYTNIPISDFGLAMMRGMGWSEESGVGKNQKKVDVIEPELRPQGLGLGANRMVKAEKPPPSVDKDGKELQLVIGAFAKITAGKYKGYYCKVQGFDDISSRIIVETTIKQNILSLNEFLVVPVTKEEYNKFSKVLNNAKYEEYTSKSEVKRENDQPKKKQLPDNDRDRSRTPKRKERRRSRSRSRKNSGKSKHRSRSRSIEYENERLRRKVNSSDEDRDDHDDSDDRRRRKSKKSKRERRRSRSGEERGEKRKKKKSKRGSSGSDDDRKRYKKK